MLGRAKVVVLDVGICFLKVKVLGFISIMLVL